MRLVKLILLMEQFVIMVVLLMGVDSLVRYGVDNLSVSTMGRIGRDCVVVPILAQVVPQVVQVALQAVHHLVTLQVVLQAMMIRQRELCVVRVM